jgi:hypothetical protein
MWMDADTWIQQWPAVEHFFYRAEINGLAICQEMDRAYLNVYNMNNSREIFHKSLRTFGDNVANRLIWMPMVNSGVFAMRADCPYWSQWRDILGAAIQRGHLNHLIEQTALNVCIYNRLPLPNFMPTRFNWICAHALPAFDEDTGLYVEPSVPHDAISIIHLSGQHTRFNAGTILDLQGNKTAMTLLYSQWKRYKERSR